MRRRFQTVLEDEWQEAVTKLMTDHRLLEIPVLNKAGIMRGIVTVDDAMQGSGERKSQGPKHRWDGSIGRAVLAYESHYDAPKTSRMVICSVFW
jgi:CBS-domain-containing membrane protein